MTLTEAIRSHADFSDYIENPGAGLLNSIAEDLYHPSQIADGEDERRTIRRIKQAIRNTANTDRGARRHKQAKPGKPRKTYEVACAHCGRPNVITLDRT